MKELFVRESVHINAPAAKIWNALINPEFTKQYMFGCEAVCDWKVGSALLWKGLLDGKENLFVKGNIVRIELGKILEYTTFSPNSCLEDIPANYLTVTYRLTPNDGGVLLEVSQGDFATVGNYESRYNETAAGWPSVLQNIKALAENGERKVSGS